MAATLTEQEILTVLSTLASVFDPAIAPVISTLDAAYHTVTQLAVDKGIDPAKIAAATSLFAVTLTDPKPIVVGTSAASSSVPFGALPKP